jgi:polysaccharide export outer membrane protein
MKYSSSTSVAMIPNAGFSILLVSALSLVSTSALAEYRLQSGDTLEVSVAGVPDLKQRAPVGVDGDIVVPLVGQIKVSGLPLSEARATITRELSNKVYQQMANDGREVKHLILPNEIGVTVAEYRPIYVNGDVAKPGEEVFRPGITVRQVIAIAGGYDQARFRLTNPFVAAADFRSEYETLLADYAAQQVRIWRLRTELGETGVEYADTGTPIHGEFRDRLLYAETQHLNARMADREKDKALLRDAITKADRQLSVLADKKKADEEESKADAEDLQKVRDLFQKGITATTRLSEARRAALLSSDQLLQTVVEMTNVERGRGEYSRQLEKIDNQSRIDDWRDLQDANLQLAQIGARLKGAREKLGYTGLLQSEFMQNGRPDITVYRRGDNGTERLSAGEDFELAPGDAVEVALKKDDAIVRGRPPQVGAAGVATR